MPYQQFLPRVHHMRFADVVQQAQAFNGWDVSYAQMSQGDYHGLIDAVNLGHIRLMRETSDRIVTQTGAVRPGCYVFGMQLTSGPDSLFNGSAWDGQCIAATRSGREFCVRSDHADMLLLEIDATLLEQHLGSACGQPVVDLFRHGAAYFGDAQAVHRFADAVGHLMRAAPAMARQSVEAQLAWRRAGERSLLDVLADVMATAGPGGMQMGMAHANRVTVVNRSLAYMRDHIEEPLQVIDICEALQVSRRTLQSCFQTVTGTNPQSYLRAHRLSGARSDLLRQDPGLQIKDVVAKWGFWHLSRFAESYRQHFGELPSATVRGASQHPDRSIALSAA